MITTSVLNLARQCLLSSVLVFGGLGAIASPADASILRDGWMYAIDAPDDSYASINGVRTVGNTVYEIYGIAIHEDLENNRIWVALNSNLPVEGRPDTEIFFPGETDNEDVPGGSVMWGDLFFDFNDQQGYQTAHTQRNLFGVRFLRNIDAVGVENISIGVYENVSGIDVGPDHSGFSNLAGYNSFVRSLGGQDTWMGSLPWNSPYFGRYSQPLLASGVPMPNIIASGDRVGDVTMHTREELEAQGFDINNFFQEGEHIIGFSFDRPPGFVGDFIATILHECLNDGVSLLGAFSDPSEPEPEPEPPPPEENPLIPLFEDCPISPGQRYALPPSRIEDGVKIIDNSISNAFYDPPPYENYEIRLGDGTLITDILQFPCGLIGQYPEEIDPDYTGEQFEVLVGNIRIPHIFNPGESVSFSDYADILGEVLQEGENGKLGAAAVVVRGLTVCTGNTDEASSVCQQQKRDPRPYICDNSGEAKSFCIQLKFDRERPEGPVMIGPEPAPEPATILGTIAFGGILMKVARSRRRS
ncbi:MAG: XDD3 family exosortase-dependent surface protein [Elainellaceae cyanobacterium]